MARRSLRSANLSAGRIDVQLMDQAVDDAVDLEPVSLAGRPVPGSEVGNGHVGCDPFANAEDRDGIGMKIRIRREHRAKDAADVTMTTIVERTPGRVAKDRVMSVVPEDPGQVTRVVGADLT